jgi:hypothetical protein
VDINGAVPTLKLAVHVIVADKIKIKNKLSFSQNCQTRTGIKLEARMFLMYTTCVWNSFLFYE